VIILQGAVKTMGLGQAEALGPREGEVICWDSPSNECVKKKGGSLSPR